MVTPETTKPAGTLQSAMRSGNGLMADTGEFGHFTVGDIRGKVVKPPGDVKMSSNHRPVDGTATARPWR